MIEQPCVSRLVKWLLPLFGLLLQASACTDVGDFAGEWEGEIATDAQLRRGFAAETRITARLTTIDLISVTGAISSSDERFDASPLEQIELSTGDALSQLTFAGDPLRSYLMFSEPSGPPADSVDSAAGEESPEAAWVVLSLFPDRRIELRIMRRNDLFGVFRLSRR